MTWAGLDKGPEEATGHLSVYRQTASGKRAVYVLSDGRGTLK